jgi:hypothetical protein
MVPSSSRGSVFGLSGEKLERNYPGGYPYIIFKFMRKLLLKRTRRMTHLESFLIEFDCLLLLPLLLPPIGGDGTWLLPSYLTETWGVSGVRGDA